MASIPAALGLGGGGNDAAAGMNYRASNAYIQNPVSTDQTDKAYQQTQTGINDYSKFLQALQAQNGIQNQSSVYNQLAGIANGQGPNPAQAMLAQSTGQNTANQAALMAGQRGAGANVGLIARQAAMQGAANQQNQIGQAASLQAQQSLGAINTMGNIAGQQVGQQQSATQGFNQAAQSEQQNLLNSIAAQNNANVASVQSQNAANSNVASGVAGVQGKNVSGLFGPAGMAAMPSGAGSAAGFAHGGQVSDMPQMSIGGNVQHYAQGTTNVQPAPSPTIGAKSNAGQFLYGFSPSRYFINGNTPASQMGAKNPTKADPNNPTGAVGQALVANLKNLFSPSKVTAPNGALPTSSGAPTTGSVTQTDEGVGSKLPAQDEDNMPEDVASKGDVEDIPTEKPAMSEAYAKGGKVPAMLSPGEVYLPPKDVKQVKDGKKDPMAGKKVPGKAKVKGDSYQNDFVAASLSPGGIVIPRHVTQGKDAHRKAYAFVNAVLAQKGRRK